ncbi:MAG: hypothetical protein HYT62_04430 [Candidatus Yanofskybacteria bacterium]|nr:hypothetical protein [Candidatus Yanofskybacteria bacterium]
MAHEKMESKSEGYGFHQQWEFLELVSEIPLLPISILSDLVEESGEVFF